jgi:CysZ protein
MVSAVLRALADVFSPGFRKVFWKAVGLSILLFIVVLVAIETAISILVAFPWPWLETILAVATGLGLFAAFFFLMAPVTAIFAGLFLDEIAEMVEKRDYPDDPVGKPLDNGTALVTGIQFGLLVLLVNLAVLPMLFLGIGAAIMVVANAYLLGREYFQMIAMRHQPVRDAKRLRKENASRVFAAGLIPAALATIPILNLLVPLFSTAYFVHIYKHISAQPR